MRAEKKYRIVVGGGEFSVARSGFFEVHDEEAHEVEDLVLRRGTSFIAGDVVGPEGKRHLQSGLEGLPEVLAE